MKRIWVISEVMQSYTGTCFGVPRYAVESEPTEEEIKTIFERGFEVSDIPAYDNHMLAARERKEGAK